MKYLLDSNAVIAIFKGERRLIDRIVTREPGDFGVSAIVALELYYGACKSIRTAENRARIEALQFEVLQFDQQDARCAGEIRANLAKGGTPIGPYDILIAGQAKARSLTLLTRNTREFQRVEGLAVEDWEA